MPRRTRSSVRAFTLIEVLVVIGIIGILAALLLPAVQRGQQRARQIDCVHRLSEVGKAFHIFAHDHKGLFPMEVPVAEGGSLELAEASYLATTEFYFSYRHFQTLSNELNTPRMLLCPADRAREAAQNFVSFNNSNVSYFIALNSAYTRPASVLAGDRNLTSVPASSSSLLRITTTTTVRWTEEIHQFRGNLLHADGHVKQVRGPSGFEMMIAGQSDLAFPSSPGGAVAVGGEIAQSGRSGASRSPAQRTPAGNGSDSGRSGKSGGLPAGGAGAPSDEEAPKAGGSIASDGGAVAGSRSAYMAPVGTPQTRSAPPLSPPPPSPVLAQSVVQPDAGSVELFVTELKGVGRQTWWLWLLLLLVAAVRVVTWLRKRMDARRVSRRFSA